MDSDPAQRGDSGADQSSLPHGPQEPTPTSPANAAPRQQSAEASVEPPKVLHNEDEAPEVTASAAADPAGPSRPVQEEVSTQSPVTKQHPESSAEPATKPTPPEATKQASPEPAHEQQTSQYHVAEASASGSFSAVYETGESSHATQPAVGATDDGASSFMDTSFGFSVRATYS